MAIELSVRRQALKVRRYFTATERRRRAEVRASITLTTKRLAYRPRSRF